MYMCLVIISSVLLYQYTTIKKERYLECTNTTVIKVRIRYAFILFLVMELVHTTVAHKLKLTGNQ